MTQDPQRGVKAIILVVDDDALITLNTVDQLTELGHTVFEAYSGREALQVLQAHPEIDALITDYSMPLMNGVQLAEAARQLRPGLPVLLATGYAELPEGGSVDLPRLEKPFRDEDLAERIAALLQVSAGSD